jgi:hypothetical protein
MEPILAHDRPKAGQIRVNVASMYLQASAVEDVRERKHDLLRRAHFFAKAALFDFQRCLGRRSKNDEADAQRVVKDIQQTLDGFPP